MDPDFYKARPSWRVHMLEFVILLVGIKLKPRLLEKLESA